MKAREDEMQFRSAITNAIRAGEKLPSARKIAAEIGLNQKRAWYLCDKWISKGWWDCGVNALSGWLTDDGKVIFGLVDKERNWAPHPLDKYGQFYLLEVAESANPPLYPPADGGAWLTLDAKDGWKVCFFYDCDDLDYIEHFIKPNGDVLEAWPDDYVSEIPAPVMAWCGPGDLERMLNTPSNAAVQGRCEATSSGEAATCNGLLYGRRIDE